MPNSRDHWAIQTVAKYCVAIEAERRRRGWSRERLARAAGVDLEVVETMESDGWIEWLDDAASMLRAMDLPSDSADRMLAV